MPEDRPNVLWITTDQQRFDTLGCYGNDWVSTPALDGLASEGVRFDRAYCQSPVCTPSRASFLTGRYPRTCRVRQNGQPLPDEERTVPRLLADVGYTNGLAGKLHVRPLAREDPETDPRMEDRLDDGYHAFEWCHSPDNDWPTNAYRQWLAERGVEYEKTPVEGSEHVSTSLPEEHHCTTWTCRQAENFVRTAADGDEPWLYSVNVFDPHPAWDPPREYLGPYLDRLEEVPLPNYEAGELDDKPRFQRDQSTADTPRGGMAGAEMDPEEHRLVRAAYWAMVDLIDERVGTLLDALEETGQREDTLVVFTSDHGEMLGDHGLYKKGPYLYEPAVRVPLIVAGPGVAEGVETDALTELVDLAPTILEAAGEDPHPGMQGRSLWPLLRGEADEGREDVYCESYNVNTRHRDPPAYATMLRTDDHKLVVTHGEFRNELYDLEADPTETHNRYGDPEYADVQAELTQRLLDRMAWSADPLPERVGPW